MTTSWTCPTTSVAYAVSQVAYNNYSLAKTYFFSIFGLTSFLDEQFCWYNAGGYVNFEQIVSAIALGVWALTLAILTITWEGLPEEWKNLLLNVDKFDPNAPFAFF